MCAAFDKMFAKWMIYVLIVSVHSLHSQPLLLRLCRSVMSATRILRVGTVENIFVECQDCNEGDRVNISVMSHPTKTKWLASTSVPLTMEKKLQAFGQIIVMYNIYVYIYIYIYIYILLLMSLPTGFRSLLKTWVEIPTWSSMYTSELSSLV